MSTKVSNIAQVENVSISNEEVKKANTNRRKQAKNKEEAQRLEEYNKLTSLIGCTELEDVKIDWKKDVLQTNSDYKKAVKSIGGARSFLLQLDSLNPHFRNLLILSKEPKFYEVLKPLVKVNSTSGLTSPFYLLSTLKANNEELTKEYNRLLKGLK